MIKCEKCNVKIADDAIVCPLCQNVLDIGQNPENNTINGKSVMYPEVENKIRKRKLAIKIIFFVSVVVELVLLMINKITYNNMWWSAITGVSLAYLCFASSYLLKASMGHRKKLEMLTVGTIVLLLVIDKLTFDNGWSIIYGIPCTVLGMELIILILVIFNRKCWQEYILLQIFLFVISAINLILAIMRDIPDYLLTIIAIGTAGLIIFGMFFFGRTRAVNEVSRRFRI